ncbi:DUF982 domain-containing protein [Rhizobium leguminosarum]|uniref:DUF982 domain-containing protein n=1 Tax=Rhizobium leguminosarum TaxID=384 RepID=UPI001FEE6A36|nr:DUF982 domain-containing protein [Rhizobium leguminosarum]MDI5929120.1 DUF982 domain-containing protein [Rhizobium leguminosarum]
MWPHRSGAHFIRARNACKAAVEDRLNHQHARDEFIAAAEEAKLSTYPSRRSFTELCDSLADWR